MSRPHRATRNVRRLQARERQALHDSLSIEEKLAKTLDRPGVSWRETKRLVEKLDATGDKARRTSHVARQCRDRVDVNEGACS